MQHRIRVALVEEKQLVTSSLTCFLKKTERVDFCGVYELGEHTVEEVFERLPEMILFHLSSYPKLDFEILKRIKHSNLHIPCSICTDCEYDEVMIEAFNAGANGCISTTSAEEEFIAAIQYAFYGGVPISINFMERFYENLIFKKISKNLVLDILSAREQEILQLLLKGKLYKEIADCFSISYETVKKHIHHIYKKLHVNNRLEVFNKCSGMTDFV